MEFPYCQADIRQPERYVLCNGVGTGTRPTVSILLEILRSSLLSGPERNSLCKRKALSIPETSHS